MVQMKKFKPTEAKLGCCCDFTWKVAGNSSNTSVRWGPPPSWREKSWYVYAPAYVCIMCACVGRYCRFVWFMYLIFHTVSMPVCGVYVHIITHSHQVPVHLITHLHVQTIQICIHITINGWKAYKHTDIENKYSFRWSKRNLSKWCRSVCVFVQLTVHLVALDKGFIVLQVCTRVCDVCSNIVIQIPEIITTIITCKNCQNFAADTNTDTREQKNFDIQFISRHYICMYNFGWMWVSNICDKDMQWWQDIWHFNKFYSKHQYTDQ